MSEVDDVQAATSVLLELGFKKDTKALSAAKAEREASLSGNGSYSVLAVFTKDQTSVLVESNVSAPLNDDAEVPTLQNHPAVAVVSSPQGRCAAKLSDLAALQAIVASLS